MKRIFSFAILFVAIGFQNANAAMNMPTYIFMNVARTDSNGQSKEIQVCANFYPNPSKKPGAFPPARSLYDAKSYQLAYYDNDDTFCTPLPANTSFSGDIIHSYLRFDNDHNWSTVSRGACDKPLNINERISILQQHNASAVLFVTTPDETHASYYDPRVNTSIVTIPIYYINKENQALFAKFVDRSTPSAYSLRFFVPKEPFADSAMLVILFISLTCVIIGGAWSGSKHYELYKEEVNRKLNGTSAESTTRSQTGEHREETNAATGDKAWAEASGSSNDEPSAAPFTWITLVFFLVIVVGFLLLLYFLYHVVVWLVIVIYVIASSCAMCECLWYFIAKAPYGKCVFRLDCLADFLTRLCRCCQCQWKLFRATIEYRHAALYAFCLSVSITWAVFRHWSYSFVLHDILATFFAIVTIRNLRIPNLKWVTCLLSLLLIYDLFMVFITPYMTPSGCSVMLDVATGGACSKSGDVPDATHNLPPSAVPPKEELPIVIRVPRFNDPMWSCYRLDVDLQYPPVILGLGDIILPGILIGYNAAFSRASKTPYQLYYVVGVVGYFFGMLFTFGALLMFQTAQPALIYLVPFTLVPTHLAALLRKDWKKMWHGQFPLVEESCPILKPEQSSAASHHPNPAIIDGRSSTRTRATDGDMSA